MEGERVAFIVRVRENDGKSRGFAYVCSHARVTDQHTIPGIFMKKTSVGFSCNGNYEAQARSSGLEQRAMDILALQDFLVANCQYLEKDRGKIRRVCWLVGSWTRRYTIHHFFSAVQAWGYAYISRPLYLTTLNPLHVVLTPPVPIFLRGSWWGRVVIPAGFD